ncbi:MAG: M28 family peptidase, partial [Armatimonadaceae bacterium]
INPDAPTQILLCAHWDTRPTADQEIDPTKRKRPIDGANDGASGVAVLLELARNLAEKKPNVGVQFVFFDGEDFGPGIENMFLGAKAYAAKPLFPKPAFGILIDMIGDKNLGIYRELNSDAVAADINTLVFKAAKDLGVVAFVDEPRHEILDDHLPLIRKGWKVIDLIDFDYGPWHTLDDTVEQCSPASLKAVGDVLGKVVRDTR